jgi:ferric enterobactin receptor
MPYRRVDVRFHLLPLLTCRQWLRPALVGLLCLLTSRAVQAQSPAVGGVVRTAAGAPVEYATVTLHRATDSLVLKTEFSDEKGAFLFEAAAPGRYLVSAAQVGFVRQWSRPFEVTGAGLEVPVLTLATSAATQLKEVKVVGQKPLYEREADRTVVNVEGSTLAAGNTTLDVLRRAPGVTVSGSDNLALRGRQGVLVLIDGKRQPMSGTELADYLRALPADQLKSIELITNPPAKYDAQGGAGIIAINLKKDQRLGTNGTMNGSYGYSRYHKFAGGLSLNHRHKKVNLFGSFNASDRERLTHLDLHRDFYAPGAGGPPELTGTTDQTTDLPSRTRAQSWKAGVDYNLSARTTVGAMVNGLAVRNLTQGTNATLTRDLSSGAVQDYTTANYIESTMPNGAANLNFRHAFADSLGPRELTADADYAQYRIDRDQLLTTYARGQTLGATNSNQAGTLTIQSIKADYAQPVTKQLTLEAGAKASRVTADNDVNFYTDGRHDLTRSNRFRYDENINAGYVNLNYRRPKLTLQAGLRAEQTNAVGQQDQQVENPNFTRHYFQLFPSAALKRTFSEQHELALSLSRRIDRPSYGQLNPFRIIIDKTTAQGGNPNLLPQTSYNLELTHTFRQKYGLGLSYSVTSRPLIEVIQPENDSTVIATTRNLDRQHNYALTLTAPVQLVKWWSMYTNVVVFYARYTGELASTNLNRGAVAATLSSNQSFTFGKGWSAELNATYQSRQIYAFLLQKALGEFAVGVQKSLWDRKGTLKLSVADLFYTQREYNTTTYNNYEERLNVRRDTRMGTLSFSYRFGNDKVAPARRCAGGAEEEKRRAG